MADEKKIKYSDSPFAPDWAKDPALRDRTITSFGKPIPQSDDLPSPFDEQSDVNDKTASNHDQTSSDNSFHPTAEQIEDILWQDTDEDIQVYCIMDGYWADGLYGRLLNSPDLSWAHMFQGDVATRNVQQAPFIIALKRGHKLTKWLIEEGWGKGWGIYFTASTKKADLLYGSPLVHDKRFLPSNEEQLKLGNLVNGQKDPLWKMRRHFRQFSDVYLESENKIVDFRYYDPSTFSVYLNKELLTLLVHFFGPLITIVYQEPIYHHADPKLHYITVAKYNCPKNISAYQHNLLDKTHIKIVHVNEFENKEFQSRTSPFLSISSHLQELFRLNERKRFAKRLASELSFYLTIGIFTSYSALCHYVYSSLDIADKLKLRVEIDILNFIKCRIHYGDDFYIKSAVMSEHFTDPKRSTTQKDKLLAHWADAY